MNAPRFAGAECSGRTESGAQWCSGGGERSSLRRSHRPQPSLSLSAPVLAQTRRQTRVLRSPLSGLPPVSSLQCESLRGRQDTSESGHVLILLYYKLVFYMKFTTGKPEFTFP
ncbi:unnamed protein product [Darwinula stevensoni]|uniref:Uncharacterized protein n=1 Tax=Darwinula stevensoni TaxID=69355 RepID=A0A7R8XEV1_9CRUS|nr:unnamed protein product [Darwinula stevensoni]CAG0890987.1 unnamed protein product [Darwinula stevensoni]